MVFKNRWNIFLNSKILFYKTGDQQIMTMLLMEQSVSCILHIHQPILNAQKNLIEHIFRNFVDYLKFLSNYFNLKIYSKNVKTYFQTESKFYKSVPRIISRTVPLENFSFLAFSMPKKIFA